MKRFYSVRFFASILLISLTTSLYAANYQFSASEISHRSAANSNGRQGAYSNNYFYRVNQNSSGATATLYVIGLSANINTTTTFVGEGYPDFSIANDDFGNLILGKASSLGRPFYRFYYSTPNGTTHNFNNNHYITISNKSGYNPSDNDESQPNRAQAFRANGNVTSGNGYIYVCPTKQKYIFRLNIQDGVHKSTDKFTTNVENGTGAMAYQYDTNKILLCTNNGLYDCTLSGSGTSGSVQKTKITVHGGSNVQSLGSVIVMLQGKKFLFAPQSATKLGIWNLSDNNTLVKEFTRFDIGSFNFAPYMTINAKKASNGLSVDFYVDWRNSGVAQFRLTAKEICEAPTFSVSGGGTSNPVVTISSATSGATIHYRIGTSGDFTTLTNGGSVTVPNVGTSTIYAYATKSGCVNSSTTNTTVAYNPQLAAPTFSVATGTQFTSMGNVTITAPSGSMLYYSINGGSTFKSALDNAVTLNIREAISLAAYATRTNYTNSTTATASYTVKCATPVITPGTGTYPKEQAVNISCSTPDATVHYTTDGTTPSASSPVYSAPLTVNDGSATSEYIPAYIMYADEYSKSEHIIPASSLTSMGASAASPVTINSLTWYLNGAPSNLGTARFKVFLKEVSGTTLSDFSGPTGGTVVYEGELNPTQTTMTVAFTTPFEYHGGNLLVGIYGTATGTDRSVYFSGITTSDNCAGSGSDSSSLSSVTFSPKKFLPKTTFTYTPTPITISQTTTIKAIAIKNGCVDSNVASETITITPQSQPVASSSINVAYSPVIGTSTNNPDRDLARIDATITFDRPTTSDGGTFPAYPSTFSGYYLDHYVVTVFTGSSTYAKTEGGADFLSVSIDAKSGAGAANTVSLKACDLKVGQQTEVYVTAHYVYQPTSAASQSSQTTKSFSGYTYTTYSPSISAKLFLFQNQEYKVWWESEHTSVTRYADVYRVEIQINDAMSTSAIPVSYYQLQMRRSPSAEWENIVDRTINNLCYGDSIEAHTTYPTGFGLAAGRFPGNYNFGSHQYTADIGTEEEWDINLEYYYAFDVTPPAQSAPRQPLGHIRNYEGNEDPTKWQFRIVAVYGGSDSVTVDGTHVTPTTDNVSESTEDVFIQHANPIITGVDSVKGDVNIKEVQYYDLRGVRLNEAPSTGFYIEVRLYDNGQIATSKRLAR